MTRQTHIALAPARAYAPATLGGLVLAGLVLAGSGRLLLSGL